MAYMDDHNTNMKNSSPHFRVDLIFCSCLSPGEPICVLLLIYSQGLTTEKVVLLKCAIIGTGIVQWSQHILHPTVSLDRYLAP